MWIDPAYREALRAVGLDSVEAALARTDGEVAAWSRTTDTLRIDGGSRGVGFYLKRYHYFRWRTRLRGVFRGTLLGAHRAQAEARLLQQMCRIGLSAVRPVAYGCRRSGLLVKASFLISEEVPGARNLTCLARDVDGGRASVTPSQRRAMIVGLAHQIAHMHEQRFSHAQVFWRNLVVRFGPCGDPEFFFLDARPRHGQRRFSGGSRWWLEELAQLDVSAAAFTTRSERLRFCREYFEYRRLTADLKRRLREIERLGDRWRGHERKRIHMSDLFEGWRRRLEEERRQETARPALATGSGR